MSELYADTILLGMISSGVNMIFTAAVTKIYNYINSNPPKSVIEYNNTYQCQYRESQSLDESDDWIYLEERSSY